MNKICLFKVERARADLQAELEDLTLRLDEAGGATAAQIEQNRRREAEVSFSFPFVSLFLVKFNNWICFQVARLRRELEQQAINHETMVNSLRKKGGEAIAELTEQLENTQMMKAKADKDKVSPVFSYPFFLHSFFP